MTEAEGPKQIPTDQLTPRVTLIEVTGTSCTLRYTLPATCTSIGGPVHVRILVRPSKLYKQLQADDEVLIQKENDMQFHFFRNHRPGEPNYSQANFEHQKKVSDVRFQRDRLWDDYVKKGHKMLKMHKDYIDGNGPIPFYGYFFFDMETETFRHHLNPSYKDGPHSIENSPETNTVTITNLGSNCFFDVALSVRRANLPEDRSGLPLYSPSKEILVGTKSAPWQLALEKAGLRNLIEPFSQKGLTAFESWMNIDSNFKVEHGIDSAVDQILQDILSRNGILTPQEKERIERTRVELKSAVATIVTELKEAIIDDTLQLGDGVVEKVATDSIRGPRFGVITSTNKDNDTCSVRFENPRTKDPGDSVIETDIATSNLEREPFTLFLSHAQAEAQNQMAHLSMLLRDKGAKIWFDMDSERLEARDMARGIHNSQVFLLYLTKSYFDRWFTKMEVSVALALEKSIIIVYEPDERHGGMGDYVQLVNASTRKFPEFRGMLLNTEAIPMARRAFQRRSTVDEICKRARFNAPASFSTSNDAEGNKDNEGVSSSSAAALALEDLREMVIDLKMEVTDLRSENAELRGLVEDLQAATKSLA